MGGLEEDYKAKCDECGHSKASHTGGGGADIGAGTACRAEVANKSDDETHQCSCKAFKPKRRRDVKKTNKI